MNLAVVLGDELEKAVQEIEENAPLDALIARFTRRSCLHEGEGNAAAAATCDIIVMGLEDVRAAVQELHRLTVDHP